MSQNQSLPLIPGGGPRRRRHCRIMRGLLRTSKWPGDRSPGKKWEKRGRKYWIKKILLIIFIRYTEITVYCNFSC